MTHKMVDPRIKEEQDWDREATEAEVRVEQMEARARVILDNVQPADICEIMDFARPYETLIATAYRDHDDVFLGNLMRRFVGMDWARDRAESEGQS